jgi:hypothetical protein
MCLLGCLTDSELPHPLSLSLSHSLSLCLCLSLSLPLSVLKDKYAIMVLLKLVVILQVHSLQIWYGTKREIER